MKFVVFVFILAVGCSNSSQKRAPIRIDIGGDAGVTDVSVDMETSDAEPLDAAHDVAPTVDAGPDSTDLAQGPPAIRVAGWNLESGDADIDTLARYIEDSPEIQLWGLSEVLDRWAIPLRDAASSNGRNYRYALGQSGGADRLLILFDSTRFDLIEVQELTDININGEVRAPLVATLQDRESGQRFQFMVNHLFRTSAPGRHQQAQLLNTWVAAENDPVIAVGDYNFDWNLPDGDNDHDRGYDLMIEDGRWEWVRPDVLVRTHCGASFNSVLDFIFVNQEAAAWNGISTIAPGSTSYCDFRPETSRSTDNGLISDHKPVLGTFFPPARF